MTVERKEWTIDQLKERFLHMIDVLEFFLKGEIAFTHYKFLNDDAEVECGFGLLKRVAEESESEFLKDIFIKNSAFTSNGFDDTFLFCLSKDSDNLYQWRSYTPNGGVAIKFNKVELFEALRDSIVDDDLLVKNVSRFKHASCRYTEDYARKIIKLLSVRYAKKNEVICIGSCIEFWALLERVLRILLTQKNPTFSFEEEERFLLQGDLRKQVEIIDRKPRIILRNPKIANAVKSVRLSPHGDVKRNRLLVEMLRDKYGLKFDIVQSNSSYNGM